MAAPSPSRGMQTRECMWRRAAAEPRLGLPRELSPPGGRRSEAEQQCPKQAPKPFLSIPVVSKLWPPDSCGL